LKPERVDLTGVCDATELARRVLQTRLGEVRRLAIGLEQRDKQALHDFRIACKRLRYAAERFEDLEPSLETAAERLALLQDTLGEVRDRDVLLTVLPAPMAETERRLRKEREQLVDRAAGLWAEVQELVRACPLIVFQ
jgi:CHAD domain-containing protein